MRILYFCDDNIPRLSWFMQIKHGSDIVQCIHGPWVETGSDYFIEGAWAEKYETKNFHDSCTLMGSGAVITNKCLTICTPCNSAECVYSIRSNGSIFFSNSIAFLLTKVQDNIDIKYLEYESDILSISNGLYKYKRTIPTQMGNEVHLHYFCNIQLDYQGDVTILDKPLPPRFKSFDDYYKYLSDCVKGIANNLLSPERSFKYSPIVFCSNGYDSPTCAVLGRMIDCDEAVVYESKKKQRSDSGKVIATQLGYTNIHEKEELDYLKYDCAEDFVSSGELGTSIFFASSQALLEGKFLLSGLHGDKVWDKNAKVNHDLKRSFYPDAAMKEFRLRVGFIKVTVPFFGVMRHEDIVRISNSNEMSPWTLNNDYDRPIPRRILEESGVPRKEFGFSKSGGAGSSLRFLDLTYLKKYMPVGSYQDFETYYITNRKARGFSLNFLLRSLIYLIYITDIHLKQQGIRFLDLGKILSIETWNTKYKCSPWAPSMLFAWGIQKVMRRYSASNHE